MSYIQIIATEQSLQEVFDAAFEKSFERFNSKFSHKIEKKPATRKEAADHLGVSLPTLDTLIKTEQLKAFNIGRQVRINWNDLDSFLNKKGGIKK